MITSNRFHKHCHWLSPPKTHTSGWANVSDCFILHIQSVNGLVIVSPPRKKSMIPTDFYFMDKKNTVKLIGKWNSLVPNILQNIFFQVPQKKTSNAGLEWQNDDDRTIIFGWTIPLRLDRRKYVNIKTVTYKSNFKCNKVLKRNNASLMNLKNLFPLHFFFLLLILLLFRSVNCSQMLMKIHLL